MSTYNKLITSQVPPPTVTKEASFRSFPCINVLWTGGLDSTARIVELSRKNLTIQPYYVIDPTRKSSIYEKKAMTNIREYLLNDTKTIAKIMPVKEIVFDDIDKDFEITSSWKILYKKYRVGSQYDYLARYAKQHGIILEVGVEKGDGRAQTSIHMESKMIPYEDETGLNFKISKDVSSTDTWNLYQYFTFPLWEKNKHAEVKMMNDLGCGDIVDMTWFCHSPLFGKPCGHCNPCKDARHYGFAWRLSPSRTILWYFMRPKAVAKSVIKKIIYR